MVRGAKDMDATNLRPHSLPDSENKVKKTTHGFRMFLLRVRFNKLFLKIIMIVDIIIAKKNY